MTPTPDTMDANVLQYELLLSRCMGRTELVERVLVKFHRWFWNDLAEFEKALNEQDQEQMAFLAHRMKGSSASVSAPQISACAARIERLARSGNLSEVVPSWEQLRQEWRRFENAVSTCGLLVEGMGKNEPGTPELERDGVCAC